jgi:hypothetical protein
MAKFDISNNLYKKLWESDEARQLISYIINDPNMVRSNPAFWQSYFSVDPYVTPTDRTGLAAFTVTAKTPSKANIMHQRAPLGDTVQRGEKNFAKYTGSISDFIADGYVEKAMERSYKEQLMEQLGSENAIIADWATNVVEKGITAADYTLSNMAAQALSKGNVVVNFGEGIGGPLYKAAIPSQNFVKAGAKAWTDTTCKLLDQMVEIERHMKEDVWANDIATEWLIQYDTFKNLVLKNDQVIEAIKIGWALDNGQILTTDTLSNVSPAVITETNFNKYVVSQYEGLSPIRVVSEKQYDAGSVISGWKSGVAVLKPVGYAGVVLHTSNLDQQMYSNYGSSVISRAFATTANGLVTVENLTKNNGDLKEWQTRVMMQAVPVLDDFLYHVIVDITTGDND